MDSDIGMERNNLLQRAIRLYIGSKSAMKARRMEVALIPAKRAALANGRDSDRHEGRAPGTVEQLDGFCVSAFPRRGEWVCVDEETNVHFMQQQYQDSSGKENNTVESTRTVYSIVARGPRAEKRVQAFVDDAFDWYKAMRKAEEEGSKRSFFVAVRPEKAKEGESAVSFKQYGLSDNKTFRSLFFPEKEMLLKLVDDFLQKRGKFAVDGFPDKLGLLLDGPPGTGKTSLIKALAHYTKRHIVNVNLSKVKTNQELMDLLFDLEFPVQGGECPLSLAFSSIIFVMEDVDAASRIVYARSKGKEVKRARRKPSVGEGVQTPQSLSDGDGRKCSSDEDAKPKAEPGTPETRPSDEADVESGSDTEENKKPAERLVESLVTCLTGAARNGEEEDGDDKKKAVGPFTSWNQPPCEDALNLAGLLNVLDGVVDSPGRIIVMTTNHPEKLDPALVRPGRINKHLRLGYMKPECLADLVEHYLGNVLNDNQRQLLASLQDRTPAQVEQACAESEGFDDLFPRLKAFGSPTDTTPSLVRSTDGLRSLPSSCMQAVQPLAPAAATRAETERVEQAHDLTSPEVASTPTSS